MTICLFSGTPGSGKSLHAAREIRDFLRFKRLPVVANFDINPDAKGYSLFRYQPNADMTPDFLRFFARDWWSQPGHRFREDNVLLVLDECQLLFNSRDWSQKDRMAWIEFFSQHRKYGYRIIFIAQFDRMIDRQIRSLVEYEYVHRKMGNLGWKGRLLTLLSTGELYIAVKRFYSMNERLGCEVFRARKSLFRMYDSYATFNRTEEDEGMPRPHRPPAAGFSGVPARTDGAAARISLASPRKPKHARLGDTAPLPPVPPDTGRCRAWRMPARNPAEGIIKGLPLITVETKKQLVDALGDYF